MPTTLWNAEVSRVGGEAAEMIEAGVLIMFGEPVPEALADISIVHDRATELSRPLKTGDQLILAGQTYILDEIGSHASDNLIELGHVVVYLNQPEQALLPGAIKASGPALVTPVIGTAISFVEL